MNTQTIDLDLDKIPQPSPILYLGQGDANATQLKCNIYSNGIAFSLSGYSVKFVMQLPDGSGYYEVSGTKSGNVATFDIDETYAAAVAGKTEIAYVEIISGSTVVASTNRMLVIVLRSAAEGVDPGTAYSNGIEAFVEDAEERVEAALEAIGDVSELAVPLMSSTTRGGAMLGDGLTIVDGALTAEVAVLPTMSASTKGAAKVGSGLSMNGEALQVGTGGVLQIVNGGTGASTAANALQALGGVSGSDIADVIRTGDNASLSSVASSGDITTEGVCYVSCDEYTTDTSPAANTWYPAFRVIDADGAARAKFQHVAKTNGDQGMQLGASRLINGASVNHGMQLFIDSSGERSVFFNDAAPWRTGLGVPGLTDVNVYTQFQYIKTPNLDRDGANPSSAINGRGWYLYDQDGEVIGSMRPTKQTDGRIQLRLTANNEKTDGTEVSNYLNINVARDGTQTYALANAAAFRNALGASSGIFPVSLGGTGQSAVSQLNTISSILEAASGYTVSVAIFMKWGPLAQLVIGFTPEAAVTAGTSFTLATVKSGYLPKQRSGGGDVNFSATLTTTGTVSVRTHIALNTTTTRYVSFMYFLA